MNEFQNNLRKLIKPIFDIYEEHITPAKENEIAEFKKFAHKKNVPEKTILELVDFYKITNRIPCLDSLSIPKIDDIILFEWWDDNELWIGQRDSDIIRWKFDKYHLGSASDLNYGDEYISENLIGILQIGIKDWFSKNNNYE